MMADLAEATKAEEEAIKLYKELMAAKTKEDVEDTVEALEEDKKFLADLEKNCAAKTKDWEYRSKMRADEILALAETIKILNDDDALELFKKTLPSPSFLQTRVSMSQVRGEALKALASHDRKD